MRRLSLFIAIALLSLPSFADRAAHAGRRVSSEIKADSSWIQRADTVARTIAADAAMLADVKGPRPIVLLETNYYALLPGEPLQLRLTTSPNGYADPVTMYLYQENRTSGERRYYNIASNGLLPAGSIADLFGTVGSPVAVFTPNLSDLVLFGSTVESPISWNVNGVLGSSMIVPTGETGLYQYVVELRNAAGDRVLARSNAMYSFVENTVNVSGTITANTTWSPKNRYVLGGFVGVAAPAVLTIEPGTVIYGGDNKASLFIRRGAKIVADGTNRRPIVFTSPQITGSRSQRDWGSLIVLGNAPINDSTKGFLEGLPSTPEYSFGGSDPNDDSGILRYVRLEFGGFEIETNQEINGLTLAGVGRGTVVDYVEVLFNKDDAFEFFGGTVDAKHLLGVGFADDGLDFDLGYQGRIQFAAMVKRLVNEESDSNVLFESDGHPSEFTRTPLTKPVVYNVTGYGTGTTKTNYGAVFRRGSGVTLRNALVAFSNPSKAPLTVRDDASVNLIGSGDLTVDNSIFFGNFEESAFGSSDKKDAVRSMLFTSQKYNRNIDPLLSIGGPSMLATLMPDLSPADGSPALDVNFVANPPDDGFFEQVGFIGAVGPHENWILSGWANFSDN